MVDSKYTLVTVAATRSRQIIETGYSQINDRQSQSKTALSKALEEIVEGLIHIIRINYKFVLSNKKYVSMMIHIFYVIRKAQY